MALKLTPNRTAAIASVWAILCLLACTSAVVAFVVPWEMISGWLTGLLVAPALLVTLVIVVASCADYTDSSTSPAASIES